MKWRYILKEIEIKTGERNVESYYRLQYEVLRRIDDGKTDEVKEYLETKGQDYRNTPFLQAYGHEGEPCPVCGTKLCRIVIGGQSSTFCPHCQK